MDTSRTLHICFRYIFFLSLSRTSPWMSYMTSTSVISVETIFDFLPCVSHYLKWSCLFIYVGYCFWYPQNCNLHIRGTVHTCTTVFHGLVVLCLEYNILKNQSVSSFHCFQLTDLKFFENWKLSSFSFHLIFSIGSHIKVLCT